MGKGGGKAPTDQTVRQISLPEFSEPYYERMLAGAEQAIMPFEERQILDASGAPIPILDESGQPKLTEEGEPIYQTETISTYRPYTQQRIDPLTGEVVLDPVTGEPILDPGQRIARGSGVPDIVESRGMVRDISEAAIPGMGIAAGAYGRGIGALQAAAQYAPGQFTAAQVDPYSGFREAQFTQFRPTEFQGFRESQVQGYGYDPTRQFTGSEAGQYMSPYMQQVLSRQADEARRQFEIGRAGRSAQAVQAGAFGGSRQAVQEALAEEGLQRQMGDIYAGGMQSAFESAQQAFQADRAAQFAREQAQVQEIARTQGISVEEAARVQQARAAEAARVQGIQQQELARVEEARAAEAARVQQAQAAELARTQGISVDEAARVQQAIEASRQFGAGQALAGEQAALGAAEGLAGLGERARAADIQGAQLREAIGKDILGEQQAQLDIDYQRFLEERDYPIRQYERLANLLTGLPAGFDVSTQGYQQYDPTQQALGAGISALGLYRGLTA